MVVVVAAAIVAVAKARAASRALVAATDSMAALSLDSKSRFWRLLKDGLACGPASDGRLRLLIGLAWGTIKRFLPDFFCRRARQTRQGRAVRAPTGDTDLLGWLFSAARPPVDFWDFWTFGH
jgi:hypothetical protein